MFDVSYNQKLAGSGALIILYNVAEAFEILGLILIPGFFLVLRSKFGLKSGDV